MTRLTDIAGDFDAVVLDQWGVLHDGSAPYPGVPETLRALRDGGTRLAVLSNSGKRADVNVARMAAMGYPADLWASVMTSGEALWQDIAQGALPGMRSLWPIVARDGDAQAWAQGLDVVLTGPGDADAVLLMGLAEDADGAAVLDAVTAAGLPILCSNPDRASPRADGRTVVSPGHIAHVRAKAGADVRFYGKPHLPVFRALERALGTANLLMAGDSLEHDVAGGHAAGWRTLFITGGLHARDLGGGVDALADRLGTPRPDYSAETVA